jgi:anti-sigma regulatory factor (Ser/Thr protein kinase)
MAITELSEVGAARQMAVDLCESRGFDETQAGKVGLCVTEAATNIVKHAGRGQIVLRLLEASNIFGLEILALDQGPGIANCAASLRNGTSTADSPGTGLGALKRLSDAFDVYAPEGKGCAIRMEMWAKGPPGEEVEVGAVCVAKRGEVVCGDAWAHEPARGRHTFMVADGLGHGIEAARASQIAIRTLKGRPQSDPGLFIEAAHRALTATRGAAVAVGSFAAIDGKGTFAGIGNIACRIEGTQERRQLASHNGTVGHNMRRVQQFDFELPHGALLIFHSDGLATHWNLADYPGLTGRHPGVIAGVLYRDHERGWDNVTVLVVRNGASA